MEKTKKMKATVEERNASDEETTPSLCNELIEEILILLPTKTLFKCNSVCKTWQTIISTSSFIQRRKSLPLPPLTSGFFFCKDNQFYALYDPDLHYCEIIPKETQMDTKFTFLGVSVIPVASHNGLLLCAQKPDDNPKFSIYHQYRYIVCNPCTRQWVVLPKSHCYHPLRNIILYTYEDGNQETHFEVVSVKDESCENVLELVVYSSERQEWKESKILHNHGVIRASSHNVLFRESVYFWSRENEHLCVYNLRETSVGLLELPVTAGAVVTLGVLGDSLCYSETYDMHICVWVLVDGAEWLLKHTITFENWVDNFEWRHFDPLAFHPLHGNMILVTSRYPAKVAVYNVDLRRMGGVYAFRSSGYFPEIPYFCPAWPTSIWKHQHQ